MHITNEKQYWNELMQVLYKIHLDLEKISLRLEYPKICPEVKSTEPNKLDLMEDDGK